MSVPTWSPDGQYVVFAVPGNGICPGARGWRQPAASADREQEYPQYPWSFTPDGKRLAYFEAMAEPPRLWTVPLEDQGGQLKAGTPEPFLKSSFTDESRRSRPTADGWRMTRTNREEMKCMSARFHRRRPAGGKWQISNSGGTDPRWSRTGHELVYRSGDQLMAVSYTVKATRFVAEKPRVWIARLGGRPVRTWDLAPDGKRVAVLTPVEIRGGAQAGTRGRVPPELLRRAAAARAAGAVAAAARDLRYFM